MNVKLFDWEPSQPRGVHASLKIRRNCCSPATFGALPASPSAFLGIDEEVQSVKGLSLGFGWYRSRSSSPSPQASIRTLIELVGPGCMRGVVRSGAAITKACSRHMPCLRSHPGPGGFGRVLVRLSGSGRRFRPRQVAVGRPLRSATVDVAARQASSRRRSALWPCPWDCRGWRFCDHSV